MEGKDPSTLEMAWLVAICVVAFALGGCVQKPDIYLSDHKGQTADVVSTAVVLSMTDAVEGNPIIAACGPNVITTVACAVAAKVVIEEVAVAAGVDRAVAVQSASKVGEIGACNNLAVLAGGNLGLFAVCFAIMNMDQ